MNDVEHVRDRNPLAEVVSDVVELRRSGQKLVARCPLPDHEDKTPSFTVYPNDSWYCFGCDRGGDVYDFVQIRKSIGFREALEHLARRGGLELQPSHEDVRDTGRRDDLERLVIEATKQLKPAHRRYLRERGLTDDSIARLRIGSRPTGVLLLPVLRHGHPVAVIEHRVTEKQKYLFTKDEPRPLMGHELLRSGRTVYVVEGYFDAAVLTQAGFDAVGLLGLGKDGDAEEIAKADRVYLMLDGDAAGRQKAKRLASDLYPTARIIDLPDGKDPNDLAVTHGDEFANEVNRLSAESRDALDLVLVDLTGDNLESALAECSGLLARLGGIALDAAVNRVYEFAKTFGIRKDTIRQEVESTRVRQQQAKREQRERTVAMVDPEVDAAAEELLNNPNILDEAVSATSDLGHVGEEINRKMVFLAGVAGHTARTHEDAIHLVVKGHSSSGKNELVRRALSLLPEDRVRILTGVSQQALVYQGGRVEGVLVFQESEGEEHGEYLIRQAMSEGQLERLTVMDNEPVTVRTYVTGSIITTTTDVSLNDENQTRVFDIHTDESVDLTREVVRATGKRYAGVGPSEDKVDRILTLFRTATGKLKPATVVIPFSEQIAESFPTAHVRARRDIKRTLNLVAACTILHQRQRQRDERGRLIASVDDYAMVYPLIQRVLASSMSGLTEKAFQIAALQKVLAGSDDGWVYRSALQMEAQQQGVASEKTVRKWSERFVDMGVWESRKEKGRQQCRSLRDVGDEPIDLPSPADLVELVEGGNRACTKLTDSDHIRLHDSGSAEPETGPCCTPRSPDLSAQNHPAEAAAATTPLEVYVKDTDTGGNGGLPLATTSTDRPDPTTDPDGFERWAIVQEGIEPDDEEPASDWESNHV